MLHPAILHESGSGFARAARRIMFVSDWNHAEIRNPQRRVRIARTRLSVNSVKCVPTNVKTARKNTTYVVPFTRAKGRHRVHARGYAQIKHEPGPAHNARASRGGVGGLEVGEDELFDRQNENEMRLDAGDE